MLFSPSSLIMKYRTRAQSALLTVILKVVGIYAQDFLFMQMFAHVAECEYTFRSSKVTGKMTKYNLQTTIFLCIVTAIVSVQRVWIYSISPKIN